MEDASMQVIIVSTPPTPSAWNGLQPVTCILMAFAPSFKHKIPASRGEAHTRSLRGPGVILRGYPDTSAGIVFFGSYHPPVGTAILLGNGLLLQTLPLILICTGVARYHAVGTNKTNSCTVLEERAL